MSRTKKKTKQQQVKDIVFSGDKVRLVPEGDIGPDDYTTMFIDNNDDDEDGWEVKL